MKSLRKVWKFGETKHLQRYELLKFFWRLMWRHDCGEVITGPKNFLKYVDLLVRTCVHMNNTKNTRLRRKQLGFIGYKFPYLLISVMIQPPSYTYAIYEVLFLSTESDSVHIGWLWFKRLRISPSASEGKVGGREEGRERGRAIIHSWINWIAHRAKKQRRNCGSVTWVQSQQLLGLFLVCCMICQI